MNAPRAMADEPLHIAADTGDLTEVQRCLNEGADANSRLGDWTPLQRAAVKGHVAIVRTLLDAGAKVDTRGTAGWTALHRAARLGHAAVAELLLANGADVNAEGIQGWTPLLRAAMVAQAATGKVLIEAGADVGRFNTVQRWTALHWAAFSGSLELATELIKAGALARLGDSASPLQLAKHYGHDAVSELLEQHGVTDA